VGSGERPGGRLEGYRTFDHTGDLGLEVWAETPARLHELAAEALIAQVVLGDLGPLDARLAVSLEGDDPEDLFVHWLNTVLLKAETEHAVWTSVVVDDLGARSLAARLEGQHLDPARHERLREVKAVSFHDLVLDLEPGRSRCRVILDI
jgi:SHS2 domain-containing protein